MKKLFTILTFAVVGFAIAQEEEPKFNVTGSVDAYFRSNLTSSNSGGANTALGQGDFSAFNNDSGFSLGLANVTLSYEGEKVGFIADLAVGQRADEYNGEGSIVNEAYMYWNVSEKVTLQMGRFNNWMGYEELSAANNFHYSMSHMFTYSARNFNGLVARFDLGNDIGLGLGLMNPVNVIEGNQNSSGAYSIAAGLWKGKTSLSFASSQETSYIDFKTAFDISESFSVALNAHMADYEENPSTDYLQPGSGFTSISAYPQIKSSESMSWGMRLEYMMFEDFANDVSVFTPTLTANYTVGALTIKPELRLDTASEDVFTDNDGEAAAGLTAFTLGAVYSF
ncbi:porin [Flavobacteriaceae bacterium]|nr:porin [Flavobacteriaceae bacterium]